MKVPRNRRWPVLLLAAALLVHPNLVATSASQDAPMEEASGAGAGSKLIDYALCAVSIMAASTGVGVTLAVLTCSKAAITWWSE